MALCTVWRRDRVSIGLTGSIAMESLANDGASSTRGILSSSPCISLFGVYNYLTVYIIHFCPSSLTLMVSN